jgi:hypothetical protein
MSVTLFIAAGPYAGQQIQVGAGQTVSIGRTERSNYAFPGDTYLSGAHFEIGCDEQECRIRDLGSSNGTFLNGGRIESAVVRDGDQIAAGESIWLAQLVCADADQVTDPEPVVASVVVQLPSPERTARMFAPGFQPKSPEQPVLLTDERKRVHDILRRQAAPLFAVVDAALDASVLPLLQSSKLSCQPLFEGEAGGPSAKHAPFLIALGQADSSSEPTRSFLEALLHAGWGRSWAIFLTSTSPFDQLFAHFRNFLLVRTSDQRPLHFRFYDPRVLRALLPTCEPLELSVIFGPIVSYLIESERPDMMLAFSRGAEGLTTTMVSLVEQSFHAQAAS